MWTQSIGSSQTKLDEVELDRAQDSVSQSLHRGCAPADTIKVSEDELRHRAAAATGYRVRKLGNHVLDFGREQF